MRDGWCVLSYVNASGRVNNIINSIIIYNIIYNICSIVGNIKISIISIISIISVISVISVVGSIVSHIICIVNSGVIGKICRVDNIHIIIKCICHVGSRCGQQGNNI
jgi:hypothetical protein